VGPRAATLLGTALFVLAACQTAPPQAATPAQVSVGGAAPQPQLNGAWEGARDVLERRCVVCHGCYDAPCQLQLGSFEGIDRGASQDRVYESDRLRASEPSRLFVDAHSTKAWRDRDFFPVLPPSSSEAQKSLLVRMLQLKRSHPLPSEPFLSPKDFDLELDRDEVCSEPSDFDDYAEEHPLWGMPYALPALSEAEHAAIAGWIELGAPHTAEPAPSGEVAASIVNWEAFLNEPSLKTKLFARYIYEHLFLASLYFHELDEHTFFRLVRSRTPPGKPVEEIPTRRPFDDPETDSVYYRLVPRVGRPLDKTHMPYALSDTRLARYRELFVTPSYQVKKLPSYDPELSANPFKTFHDLPVTSRYRFMLEEAEFTMMGFIKGPVCRGQVALNVINERFWVAFVNPDAPWVADEAEFLAKASDQLNMPAGAGSNGHLWAWFKLAKNQRAYLQQKSRFLDQVVAAKVPVSLAGIWNGDGKNDNAALTVLRHFDSATVVKGFVGGPPKTAWVVGYALLERIHYLLVAGFDVFGNVGHQLTTRLYMDFLRMEGEHNFLLLVPPARRHQLVDFWYRDVKKSVKDEVFGQVASFSHPPDIAYHTDKPELELFTLLEQHLDAVRVREREIARIADVRLRENLERLNRVRGQAAAHFSEVSFIAIEARDGETHHVTLVKDTALANVAQLFGEDDRRRPEEDELRVVDGLLGAYPDALFLVSREELAAFVSAAEQLDGDDSYQELRKRFGVLRTHPAFWDHADRLHEAAARLDPMRAALFDFNRLDGR
jgi:Fatty acid cis/trans isomerase (CTI)